MLNVHFIFAIVGALTLLYLAKRLLESYNTPLNTVPGPWLAKWTNLRLKLAVITGQRVHYIHALHERYGPYVRISPTEIAVNDPAGCKQIHAINSGFEKTEWYDRVTAFDRPTLFVMADARAHAVRRRLFARGFSKSNIRQHWEPAIKQKIELAVSQIKAEASSTGSVDILKWWTLMANDVSAKVLFGDSFHVLEQGQTNQFIETLTSALMINGIGAELPLVRSIGQKLPFKWTREIFCTNEILDPYAESAVRNMRASQGGKNIFAHIQAESEKGEVLDDRDVQVEAMGLFVAGTDTTAISITYLLWAVLSRPVLQKQIEEEVAALPDGFSDLDVERLPLLNATIEETLRLYGAAPGALPRVVPHGGVDMGGYYISQGTVVSTQAYSMHRDPKVYPDPEEFKPRRWLDEANTKDRSDAAKPVLSAFGSGSRSCLGLHIAYSELRLAAAEFFRQCPGSGLADSTTPESMAMENFFLIAPKAHKCEIVVGGERI